MKIPRIVVAATHSGAGKTTLATGIMAALARRGRPVQAYKVGPDYIDPSYHAAATGRPARNLDRWLLGEHLPHLFEQSAAGSWAVVEGVMGLFDGMSGTRSYGSTADVAKLIEAPVVLVVDAASLAQSAAAVIFGFSHYDPNLRISGVIFNRVKSPAQEKMLQEAVEDQNIPVLGYVPLESQVRLPERHLGLVPVGEEGLAPDFLGYLSEWVEKYIDLSLVEQIMQEASPLAEEAASLPQEATPPNEAASQEADRLQYQVDRQPHEFERPSYGVDGLPLGVSPVWPEKRGLSSQVTGSKAGFKPITRIRLGLAWDQAFLFYYQDALDALVERGFELTPFSPLHDTELPSNLDGLMLGGGFPELHLAELSRNVSFLESLRSFAQSEKPIYAECGGYMYLGREIRDFQGESYSLAGIIPMKSEMTPRLQGMGYREGRLDQDSFLGPKGTVVHGHEFHYSRVEFSRGEPAACQLFKGGEFLRPDGYAKDNLFASYLHLNFAGYPEILDHWLEHYGKSEARCQKPE